MDKEKNIEVAFEPEMLSPTVNHSQSAINDLIGNPPGWLLRSGITMIAIVTSIIIGGSYFFSYPDKLVGLGSITSTTPPIEIICRSTGYIDVIHMKEGSNVKKGDLLLYINNTTNQDQLVKLQRWIGEYENVNDPREFLSLSFEKGLQLGSIQAEYANLQLRYNELQQTLKEGVIFQQINNLDREIEKIRKLNNSQNKEKEIFLQELNLSKKDYNRNEELSKNGVISAVDLERAKTKLLQSERQFEGMNNTIIQNNIRIEQLELEKLKLKEQRSNTIKGYLFSISEIISRIRSSIENWDKKYKILAPIDGELVYTKEITDKRNLNQGDIIGYITPNQNKRKYVSAILPVYNIGKVKEDQKVILKFDAYPYKEYGVVLSSVEEISKLPELDNKGELQYEVKIPLEDVIITDFQDTIQYNPKMTVRTEIVTENRTIFERIFNQLTSLASQI